MGLTNTRVHCAHCTRSYEFFDSTGVYEPCPQEGHGINSRRNRPSVGRAMDIAVQPICLKPALDQSPKIRLAVRCRMATMTIAIQYRTYHARTTEPVAT